MRVGDRLNRWLTRVQRPAGVVPPGVYPYFRQADGQQTRFHLRVDPDGGMLLANATRAARLTVTGTVIAKRLLDGHDPQAVARDVQRSFRGATAEAVRRDVEMVRRLIDGLAAPGDNYPILNLSDAAFGTSPRLETPLSADLPLAAPEQLVPVLDRLWQIGIPHVTLCVTESPDPRRLVRAVERAEDLGMIAGVRGWAGAFDQPPLLKDLALAGIDHVNLYYASAEAAVHDSLLGEGDHDRARRLIGELIALEVCPVAEVPLTTFPAVEATVEPLIPLGVQNFAFFAIAVPEDCPEEARDGALGTEGVTQAAALIEESSADWNVRSLWYPPVRRDPRWTLAEQIRRGPSSSGDHALRISADGTVFPPRGPFEAAGNVLRDDWDTIRRHPALRRDSTELARPRYCDACPGLSLCAANCPRSSAGWVESWPPGESAAKEPDR